MANDVGGDPDDNRRGFVVSGSVVEWGVIRAGAHTAPATDARIELRVPTDAGVETDSDEEHVSKNPSD